MLFYLKLLDFSYLIFWREISNIIFPPKYNNSKNKREQLCENNMFYVSAKIWLNRKDIDKVTTTQASFVPGVSIVASSTIFTGNSSYCIKFTVYDFRKTTIL